MKNLAPQSSTELEQRLAAIAGLRIVDLADPLDIVVPNDLRQQKGFIGQLLEMTLGADGGNLAQPDFSALGIELKTIPVNDKGLPTESTYISVVPLLNRSIQAWETSVVRAKLSTVVWLPIESDRSIPVAQRRIGAGFVWQPDERLLDELKADYEELMNQVVCGDVESITADQGQWLQIRPKAANSQALTEAIGPDGCRIKTLPRGFYLRTALTRQILAEQFGSRICRV